MSFEFKGFILIDYINHIFEISDYYFFTYVYRKHFEESYHWYGKYHVISDDNFTI